MSKIHVKHWMFLIVLITASVVKSQDTLFVKKINGFKNVFSLNEIKKITFSDENLLIHLKIDTTKTIRLDSIIHLSFENFLDPADISHNIIQESFVFYPLPARNELQLQYLSDSNTILELFIYSTDGKMLYNKEIISIPGKNYEIIDVSYLSKGIHICRLTNGSNIMTFKILVN